MVNTIAAEAAEIPFGGVKRSGFGREMGPIGMGEFVEQAPPLRREVGRRRFSAVS